jgi:hypothetical protein
LLNARDGSVLRRFIPLGYGAQDFLRLSAVDERTGSIYLYTQLDPAWRHPGIIELDPKRGKIVRRILLLHPPSALAVAERARRIFVVDSQAGSVTKFRADP